MLENLLIAFVLLPPAAFIVTALVSWYQPGHQPSLTIKLGTVSAMASIVAAAASGYIVYAQGLFQTSLIGWHGLGFSLRLDALSAVMVGMIALLGFVIFKFSINYLEGDHRQGAFMGRLAAAIASVQLLVLAGNLGLLLVAWVLTSVSLHRLLVFYKQRPGAVIAAKKKFIVARLADLCLLTAFVMFYGQFGTGNLETIFETIKSGLAQGRSWQGLEAPAVLLALAALLKSAQFPTHGWLVEVMETPTPVSALLHAGLLNAGPFLIIRMSHVIEVSTAAPVMLMVVGGFTALFGSVVYLTQPSVKTALGYSSVAHMGFSLMVCGMGVYPAAMLHLVAHSFYKAHAFLSSGSAVDIMKISKVGRLNSSGNPWKVIPAFGIALTLYAGVSALWGVDIEKDFPLLAIGAVIVMGLSKIFVTAIEAREKPALFLHAGLLALLVTVAFFTLESAMHHLLVSQIPQPAIPGMGVRLLTGLLLAVFATTVVLQIALPKVAQHPFSRAFAVHLRNGFYANAIFDRLIGSLRTGTSNNKQLITWDLEKQAEPQTTTVGQPEKELTEA